MKLWTRTWNRLALASAFGFVALLGPVSQTSAADTLTIGSVAPELDIEHWVQNGNGRFKPVTKFAKDKVYVVEFWATWCGPCVASMPHLADLQKKFASGVQIVSISNEDLETVEKFLDRPVSAKKKKSDVKEEEDTKADEQTYRDLTSTYCLTTDPDSSCHKAYMEAANQNGIPCAFIVGKDQKIEWIGHPMSMDETLTAVVEGTWDRAAFAEKFKEQEVMQALMADLSRSMRSGKTSKALSTINAAIEDAKDPMFKKQLKMMKVQIAMSGKGVGKELTTILEEAYGENADNPAFINSLAWGIYEKNEAGELDDKALVTMSRKAAQKVADAAPAETKGAILDTIAHLQFLEGDIETAMKTQAKAIELAEGDMKAEMSVFLKTLQEAAKKTDK
ncbi:MAG: redoxin domain-containing protein [Pirellula sp.]|nr:redoxin domain-containing protein [Pirellula sp.]